MARPGNPSPVIPGTWKNYKFQAILGCIVSPGYPGPRNDILSQNETEKRAGDKCKPGKPVGEC